MNLFIFQYCTYYASDIYINAMHLCVKKHKNKNSRDKRPENIRAVGNAEMIERKWKFHLFDGSWVARLHVGAYLYMYI